MSGLSETEYKFKEVFGKIQERLHATATEKGFWEDDNTLLAQAQQLASTPEGINAAEKHIWRLIVGQKIALIHSETSEGLEGARKGLMDDHLPGRSMLECELADTIIRCMDLAEWLGLDLAGAILEKHSYNKTRPYKHGKAF